MGLDARSTCWDGVEEDMRGFGLSRWYAQFKNRLRSKSKGNKLREIHLKITINVVTPCYYIF